MSSSLNPLRQPATMSSTVVPSCCAHGGGQALHLLAGRRPRRDGLAVAVVVGVHLRGREAERPLRQRGVQRSLHGVDVVRRGGTADGALAHDEPAQRRVADEEARRSPRCGRRAGPASRRRSSSPTAGRPAAPPAACPRPAPSSARCSRRAPAPWAPARSRSCRRAPWSRRAAATGWRWDPRRAGRRSACAGRRSPERPACRWRRSRCPRRRRRHRPDAGDRAHPRSRRRPGPAAHPVPSTTVPPRMVTVMPVPPCSPGPGRRTRTRWRAKACMPSVPSSTPKPDCFHPPIGAYMSMADMPWALTNTVPADSRDATSAAERVVVAPDRRAEPERGVVGRVDRLGRCRRRGSPAGRGRTAPRARCRRRPAAPPRAPARRSSPRIPRPRPASGPAARARLPAAAASESSASTRSRAAAVCTGPIVTLVGQAVADHLGRQAAGQRVHRLVQPVPVHVEPLDRHAHLPARDEGRLDDAVGQRRRRRRRPERGWRRRCRRAPARRAGSWRPPRP